MARALASKRVARAPAFARQAAIIGPTDDRAELSRVPGLKDIGFGRDEFRQAMACTGTIVCAVNLRTGTLTAMASAASVVSANQIVTAAHVFFDPKTGQRLASLQSCQFRNYADRRAGIPILVTSAFERQLRENNPYKSGNQGRDWAAVRLRSAIPNCKPYEADASGDWLAPGTELLAISRRPQGPREKVRRARTDRPALHGAQRGTQLVRDASPLFHRLRRRYRRIGRPRPGPHRRQMGRQGHDGRNRPVRHQLR